MTGEQKWVDALTGEDATEEVRAALKREYQREWRFHVGRLWLGRLPLCYWCRQDYRWPWSWWRAFRCTD